MIRDFFMFFCTYRYYISRIIGCEFRETKKAHVAPLELSQLVLFAVSGVELFVCAVEDDEPSYDEKDQGDMVFGKCFTHC